MKLKQNILLAAGAVLLIGAFISFLLFVKTEDFWLALVIGYCYALFLAISVALVRKYVLHKLIVLPIAGQWVLRSVIYTVTISFAYLLGLLVHTLLVTPYDQLKQMVQDRFWQALVAFISDPLHPDFSRFLSDQQQPILIIFFAVLVFIGVISLVGSYVELKWRTSRDRQLRDRAELNTLKSQIEPHFLYNSLNTVISLIKVDPDKAEELIIQLSEILQYRSIYAKRSCVALHDEITFTKKYANLVQARFDSSMQITWDVAVKDPDYPVPVLILQPVIENCIQHAWHDKKKMLEIQISIKQDTSALQMTVTDNGRGIILNRLNSLPIPDHALANIHERLHVMYHKTDLLQLVSTPGHGTMVGITIPDKCYD